MALLDGIALLATQLGRLRLFALLMRARVARISLNVLFADFFLGLIATPLVWLSWYCSWLWNVHLLDPLTLALALSLPAEEPRFFSTGSSICHHGSLKACLANQSSGSGSCFCRGFFLGSALGVSWDRWPWLGPSICRPSTLQIEFAHTWVPPGASTFSGAGSFGSFGQP